MNERNQLAQAKYFLNRMKEIEGNYDEFSNNLSAFLSSARTVMQYIYEEVKNNRNVKWYKEKMSKSDVLKFFKSTRDLIIHVVPCKLIKNVTVEVSPIEISTTFSAVAISSSGGIVYAPKTEVIPSRKRKTISVHTYKFDMNWYDRKTKRYTEKDKKFCQGLCQKYDVMTFCSKYIKELEVIVNEGVKKGIISG